MGYLVCDECGGYYELKPGESAADFDKCDCGGKLKYSHTIKGVDPKYTQLNSVCLKCGAKNPADVVFCSECGSEMKPESNKTDNTNKGIFEWWDKQENGVKAGLGIGGICCIGLILILGMAAMSSPDKNTNSSQQSTDVLSSDSVKSQLGGYKINSVGVDGGSVTITYDLGFVNDNKDVLRKSSEDTINMMEKLFKDSRITSVTVISQGEFTDQYGKDNYEDAVRITINKATADKIDWNGIKSRLYGDVSALINVADTYSVHPSVLKSLY